MATFVVPAGATAATAGPPGVPADPPAAAFTPPTIPLPAPGAPVATLIDEGSATVTWGPSDGPVFRYSMQVLTTDGWQGYLSSPTNTLRMAGLTPDTEYTIRVTAAAQADSGYGASQPSEPMTFTTLPDGSLPPRPYPTCKVDVTWWDGGFSADVLVGNPATVTVTGWTLLATTVESVSIDQVWNAQLSQSGATITMTPVTGNAAIPPGSFATAGMSGTYTGDFQAPSFLLAGGAACEVTVHPLVS